MEEKLNIVKVLSTFNLGDIALIKGLLDEANIQYFFQGENMSHIRGTIEPAILMVNEKDINIVQELLENFDLKFLHFSK